MARGAREDLGMALRGDMLSSNQPVRQRGAPANSCAECWWAWLSFCSVMQPAGVGCAVWGCFTCALGRVLQVKAGWAGNRSTGNVISITGFPGISTNPLGPDSFIAQDAVQTHHFLLTFPSNSQILEMCNSRQQKSALLCQRCAGDQPRVLLEQWGGHSVCQLLLALLMQAHPSLPKGSSCQSKLRKWLMCEWEFPKWNVFFHAGCSKASHHFWHQH